MKETGGCLRRKKGRLVFVHPVGVTGVLPFYVFLTVHHIIDLFHLPTLMHSSFIH